MTTRTTGSGTIDYTYAGTDHVELTAVSASGGRSYAYGRTDGNGLPIIESFVHGGTTYSYLYDPQGTPLAWLGSNAHYLAMDGLGSPVALVNHSGGQTGAYAYDPYGQTTATPVGGSAAIQYQIYGYAGGFDDPTSALVHFGKRWYDPVTGRWTQQDSIETLADPSRANRYEYASSNPVNYVDTTGLDIRCEIAGRIAGVFGAGLGGAIGLPGGPVTTAAGAFVGGRFFQGFTEGACRSEGDSAGERLVDGLLGALDTLTSL